MTIIKQPNPYGGGAQSPSSIIIHSMSEFFQVEDKEVHAADFLESIKLSAHALICPDGTVIECRKPTESAYHAKGFNTDSIGIEFLVKGKRTYSEFLDRIDDDWVTAEQFKAGVDYTTKLLDSYHIREIFRHSDVDPKRKRDPGKGFPWHQFLDEVGYGMVE